VRVCVVGLWHLGTVTAACVASLGHDVVAWDQNHEVIDQLTRGIPPVGEPGLRELIDEQVTAGRLRFSSDRQSAVRDASIVWITYDTPVDDDDHVDVEFVKASVAEVFADLPDDSVVLLSSQLPVGSTADLERRWQAVSCGRRAWFAYSPENLRLGTAIDVFLRPDRIILGIGEIPERIRSRLGHLFGPLEDRLLWMGVESAEMTKHAVNAFLATSVTFINEVSRLCEAVGADASEVERGLKTEHRIGPRAYLGPGAAFAGGTLARDVNFLRDVGAQHRRPTPFLNGLVQSNARHRSWALDRLIAVLGDVANKRVAVWGLTYKANTTTLRRSDGVGLCRELRKRGARVYAHDPTVVEHPRELDATVECKTDPLEAARGADALVLATAWPEYRIVTPQALKEALASPIVIDASRFLGATVGSDSQFQYFSVGRRQ
jgi:UDPglucose 6-dehydrogenase